MDPTRKRRRLPPSAAIALPNGFTLANLFFGMFAIVAASRGEFDAAARFIVFGAIADTLDGRIARATNSGSKFGSELDSLVDALSFGTAPALIMYFLALNEGRWDWIFCFFFTACAVMRLARFNVEQAGKAKTHFTGLPSPAAGMTLATYYWFSQTSLYTETMIADLPWHQMLRWVMLGLGMLMISNVQYAAIPTVGFRSLKGLLGLLLVIVTLIGVVVLPQAVFFPGAHGICTLRHRADGDSWAARTASVSARGCQVPRFGRRGAGRRTTASTSSTSPQAAKHSDLDRNTRRQIRVKCSAIIHSRAIAPFLNTLS